VHVHPDRPEQAHGDRSPVHAEQRNLDGGEGLGGGGTVRIRVVTGTTVKDADLRDTVTAFGDGRYAVVVDDCEQITVVPSEEGFMEAPLLLQDIAGPGALGRQALVLVGDAQPIVSGQRRSLMRVVTEVMTAGTRILLTPMSNPVARELGFTLEGDQFFAGPPGRGYLTAGRALHLIHFGQS